MVDESKATLRCERLPLARRIYFTILVWLMKSIVTSALFLRRTIEGEPANERPTFSKAYPVRPHLVNRYFFPRHHKAGEVLPLFVDVHGGGFTIGIPSIDDSWCSFLANKFRVLVVSVDYSKAPVHKFPVPTHDVGAICEAILADASLPFDKKRTAIGGFSAGANLALSAVQLPALEGKFNAIVPFYAPVDFSLRTAEKLKLRPYKTPDEKDGLGFFGPIFNYAYLHPGQETRDPLLSPFFADPRKFPKYICAIDPEYDMLTYETKLMMQKLAKVDNLSAEEETKGWERGPYKYIFVPDAKHSFNFPTPLRSKEDLVRLAAVTEVVYNDVGEWLFKGPYAK